MVGAKTCIPSRSTQKCFTPTLGVNTNNILDRFLHPPNKCSKVFVAISQKFYCREEAWAMQKLFIKKERRKSIEKMDKCPRYLKQWVLRCPPEKKREMNKIAHVFLQKFFKFQTREICFKEHSRIR